MQRYRNRVLGLVLITAAAAAAVILPWRRPPPPPADLNDARAALRQGDFEMALDVAAQAVDRDPASTDGLILAADAATRLQRYDEALAYYARVPDEAGSTAAGARRAAAEILIERGQSAAAESLLREALRLDPELLPAHEVLATLLNFLGRRWEASPHYFALVRADLLTLERLLLLGNTAKDVQADDGLLRMLAAQPDDLSPNLGLARSAMRLGDPARAKQLLSALLKQRPELTEARVWLGLALLESSPQDMASWEQQLPRAADEHPGIWFVRGLWAKRLSQHDSAARCFWEAARRDPNHAAAHYQLAQMLAALGDALRAAPFAQRAETLQSFAVALERIHDSRDHLPPQRQAAELAQALGRYWEARAWCASALSISPSSTWARELLDTLQARFDAGLPQTAPSHCPALAVDLSNYPLPEISIATTGDGVAPLSDGRRGIRFREVASAVGIDFTYFGSRKPPTRSHRMFEITGGGAGVLDFDNDGWPDLYLTQGSHWPPKPDDREYLDALYRNLGGRFVNVAHRAGIVEPSFGQGIAAGDVNDDGFDDLYVANIGANRLFLNNGDGSFTDASSRLAKSGDGWTVSCAVADLSGDGLADLYDVNYARGGDVYQRRCDSGGELRACSPLAFSPHPDRLQLNTGGAGFADVSEQTGVLRDHGNGLGVVVARFGGAHRNSLFIANDQMANFLLVNEPRDEAPYFRLSEQALTSGLAYDGAGRAQACMGVAADDADGDGRLDLLVTNFHQEANTLYLQQQDRLFVDAAAVGGLVADSVHMLGFGAQFLDAQLNGWPDLVVANGHIDDLTHLGVEYQMRPQFFANRGGAKFSLVEARQLGRYFQTPRLGRALTLIDFNNDGREDFVVTHLGSPAALLENASDPTGAFLALQLRGVKSSRGAVGAIVEVQAGGRTRTRQLTAGSGYLASNQRRLVFGLGEASNIDRLIVTWPSGARQEFAGAPVDANLMLVEGRDAPSRLDE